jgi:hypothetical protein
MEKEKTKKTKQSTISINSVLWGGYSKIPSWNHDNLMKSK